MKSRESTKPTTVDSVRVSSFLVSFLSPPSNCVLSRRRLNCSGSQVVGLVQILWISTLYPVSLSVSGFGLRFSSDAVRFAVLFVKLGSFQKVRSCVLRSYLECCLHHCHYLSGSVQVVASHISMFTCACLDIGCLPPPIVRQLYAPVNSQVRKMFWLLTKIQFQWES